MDGLVENFVGVKGDEGGNIALFPLRCVKG